MKRTPPAPFGHSGGSLCARWLGQQLRAAREATGLTLKDASAHLLRDTGSISRFENGRLPPKPADVGALMDLYRVEDPATRDAMDRLSRDVWVKGWWDEYAGRVSLDLIDLAWVENRAHALRIYAMCTVPDLLQTADFARATIRAADPDAPAGRATGRLEFQTARRRLLARDDRPRLSAVIDESVLYRPVGGTAVLEDQLRYLLTISAEPDVSIRVLTLVSGGTSTAASGFTLFDLPLPYSEVGYTQTLAGPVWAETGIGPFTRAWDRITQAALPEEQSAALIEHAIKQNTRNESAPPGITEASAGR